MDPNGTLRVQITQDFTVYTDKLQQTTGAVLTVLSVQQHLEAVGLIVVEGLSDFVYGLFVRQLPVHETGKEGEQKSL